MVYAAAKNKNKKVTNNTFDFVSRVDRKKRNKIKNNKFSFVKCCIYH